MKKHTKKRKTLIAPSIERADWLNLEIEIRELEAAGADLLHIDIMDRTYGNTILFSPKIIPALKKITRLPLDIHMYVSNPEHYFPLLFEYCQDDYINIEIEAVDYISRLLNVIAEKGCKPAISLDVGTSLCFIEELIEQVDLINLLVRNTGFSDLPLEDRILAKVEKVNALTAKSNRKTLIEVDGSIGFDDAAELVKRGANVLVLGSKVIFREECSYSDSIELVRKKVENFL